jgi:peptidylamidoglycolate lyase
MGAMRSHTSLLLTGTAVIAVIVATAGLRSEQVAAGTRYEEVKGWPSLPAGVQMGEAAGVAVDANGHVLVFHRPGRGFDTAATELLEDPAVLEIDPDSGRLIHSWGANTFLVPHGITVDRENNVFLTDVA